MRRLSCFLLLSWAWLILWPGDALTLDKARQERFLKRVEWHKKMKTPYVWGGTDCSGTLTDCAIDAGIPVLRTTSLRMSQGLDGWKSIIVHNGKETPGDLLFWTFSKDRVNGHVGVKNADDTFCHASFSKKYFTEESIHTQMYKDAVLMRHLTYGEDREKGDKDGLPSSNWTVAP